MKLRANIGEVRAKKPSLTLNLGTYRRTAGKEKIAQRSLIQAAATMDFARSGYLAITVVVATQFNCNKSVRSLDIA
ncbi:hypothetical protein J6590_080729, partial [Homalodisca vitripennis]